MSGVVRTVTETTQGVLEAIDRRSKTAVLLLRGTSLEEGWLLGQSTIDTVLEDADCDVFVENIGAQVGTSALYVPDAEEHTVVSLSESAVEPIDSVLLPVGPGPHAALAAEAARAIARAAGAPVTIIHVVSPDASEKATDDAEDLLRFAEYILGSDVEMTSELISATDTTDMIIQHAQEHDVTSIRAPEAHSSFKNLIFESVQETLTERNDVTVLMARDADRTMRSLYYRWKQGMETEARPDDN